jgi:hypothetical protein
LHNLPGAAFREGGFGFLADVYEVEDVVEPNGEVGVDLRLV